MISQPYIDIAFANVLATLGRTDADKYARAKLLQVKIEIEKIKTVYPHSKKAQKE